MSIYFLLFTEVSMNVQKISLPSKASVHIYINIVPPLVVWLVINTWRPRQDGRHFADDIFTCIFFNENCCILIKFSLKYVCKGQIINNPALVQIMAWRRSGDNPLSEPMIINLPMHICVTQPQWVNKVTINSQSSTYKDTVHSITA